MEDYTAMIRSVFEMGSVRDAIVLFETCIHNAFPTFHFRGRGKEIRAPRRSAPIHVVRS